VLGSTTVWRLSTVKAAQAMWTSVATTRPEPLARLVTGASRVMTASSCSTAVPPVAIVTVRPGPTARRAPFPASTRLPRTPPGSKTSKPTSTATGARLVQMTSVSTLFFLITPGSRATSCAAFPSLKVGSGVSVTPPRADATRQSVAARPRTVRGTLISASGLRQLDELELGQRGRRERGDGRILDGVQLVGDDGVAGDVLGGRDHPARAVTEETHAAPRRVQREGLVLVQHSGGGRADRHRLADADVEEGPRADGDRVPQGSGLVEDLETDVDRDRIEIGADEVSFQVVVLDHARGDVDAHRGPAVREGRERGVGRTGCCRPRVPECPDEKSDTDLSDCTSQHVSILPHHGTRSTPTEVRADLQPKFSRAPREATGPVVCVFCLLVGPLGIRLAAEEPAVGGEAARDRDGAVAREGADLDGPARAEEAREHGDTFRERANSRHRWSPTLRGEPSPL